MQKGKKNTSEMLKQILITSQINKLFRYISSISVSEESNVTIHLG